jgi:hypothetical protein
MPATNDGEYVLRGLYRVKVSGPELQIYVLVPSCCPINKKEKTLIGKTKIEKKEIEKEVERRSKEGRKRFK